MILFKLEKFQGHRHNLKDTNFLLDLENQLSWNAAVLGVIEKRFLKAFRRLHIGCCIFLSILRISASWKALHFASVDLFLSSLSKVQPPADSFRFTTIDNLRKNITPEQEIFRSTKLFRIFKYQNNKTWKNSTLFTYFTEPTTGTYHNRWQICQPKEIMIFNKNPDPFHFSKSCRLIFKCRFQACFERQSKFDMGIVFPEFIKARKLGQKEKSSPVRINSFHGFLLFFCLLNNRLTKHKNRETLVPF